MSCFRFPCAIEKKNIIFPSLVALLVLLPCRSSKNVTPPARLGLFPRSATLCVYRPRQKDNRIAAAHEPDRLDSHVSKTGIPVFGLAAIVSLGDITAEAHWFVSLGGNGHSYFYRMWTGLYLPAITPPHFLEALTPLYRPHHEQKQSQKHNPLEHQRESVGNQGRRLGGRRAG